MPAPLSQHLLATHDDHSVRHRRIDDHYHLQMCAQSAEQIKGYLALTLDLEQRAAAANLNALGLLHSAIGESNSLLGEISSGVHQLDGRLAELNETASATLDAVYAQTASIEAGFDAIANEMIEQRKVLLALAEAAGAPYRQQANEVLSAAERALSKGMGGGKYQAADYEHALRLLQEVLANPIGGTNYVAWFQLGWLRWKALNSVDQAEVAFFEACRLSRGEARAYHVMSLRHLAHMQYLQGKLEDAYQTSSDFVQTAPDDYDARFEVARYAARTNREEEAQTHLEWCIQRRPETIHTMFAEEDFLQ